MAGRPRAPRSLPPLLRLCTLSALVLGTALARSPASGGGWTTYGASTARHSAQDAGPPLDAVRVFWRSPHLDGAIHGEALINDGRVDVATEGDTVYALSATSGRVIWRTQLGRPVPASALPCGDLTPTVGVTSTMVLDTATGMLFASAEVLENGEIRHELVALSAQTGAIEWRRQLPVPGATAAQLQRAALTLDTGRVVVGFGGNYGDCGDYRGALLGVPESGRGAIVEYVVPTTREGAVWAPSGESVDAAGDIFFATGNGSSTTRYDEGDSVIELGANFRRRAFFAPSDWRQLNASDGDLGSSAPMVLSGHRLLIVGKNVTAYLLSSTHLGGFGPPLASVTACFSIGGDAYLPPDAYIACPGATLLALRVGARSLRVLWRGPAGTSGSPTVAGGLVWVLGNGHLHGLVPSTGHPRVDVPVIKTEPYVAPSAGGGLLVVPGAEQVEAFIGVRRHAVR